MEKKTRTYQIGNKSYCFNSDELTRLITELSRSEKRKKTSEEFLGKWSDEMKIFVSPSTIKGWMYGLNSPASLDIVERIAEGMGLDKMALLYESEKVNNMNVGSKIDYDGMTKVVVSEIYGEFVKGIEQYRVSEGFSERYYEMLNADEGGFQGYEQIEKMSKSAENLDYLIRKSRVYLPKNVVNSLLSLMGRVYESFLGSWQYFIDIYARNPYDGQMVNVEQPDGTIIEKTWEEVGPTGYDAFLDGKADTEINRAIYLQQLVNGFYTDLDNILANYIAK